MNSTSCMHSSNRGCQSFQLAIMPTATSSITTVAAHPTIFCGRESRSCPVTFGLAVISIITIMTGTATTPLMTALQKAP